MQPSFAGASDCGRVRASNQDRYCSDPQGRFFLVADGMGGHAGGERASELAITAVRDRLARDWDTATDPGALLAEAIAAANTAITTEQGQHPERSQMGTTLVVLALRGEQAWCAHVGDSRLYRLRAGELAQLTTDHNWAAQAVRAGELSPEQARSHPYRNLLVQCLGQTPPPTPEVAPLAVQAGDRWLLCSDGLNGELTDAEIRDSWQASDSCQAAVEVLIAAAKARGGSDNITAVAVAAPS